MNIIETIKPYGGIIENNHFVYASGDHGSAWINKDSLTPNAHLMHQLTKALAEAIQQQGIEFDLVCSPAIGGIFISHWLGYHFNQPSIYTERVKGDSEKRFTLERNFKTLTKGKRTLLCDDVINTGHACLCLQDLQRTKNCAVIRGH